MPSIELNPELTEIVEARLEIGRKMTEQRDRFRRYSERKLARLDREFVANSRKCQQAVAKSLNIAIPSGAFMGLSRPGVGVVSWSGPDPREVKMPDSVETPPDGDAAGSSGSIDASPDAKITPMPVAASNGHDH